MGLRFVRELEQGKPTLQLDKVNAVLRLFGHELAPTPVDRSHLTRWPEKRRRAQARPHGPADH